MKHFEGFRLETSNAVILKPTLPLSQKTGRICFKFRSASNFLRGRINNVQSQRSSLGWLPASLRAISLGLVDHGVLLLTSFLVVYSL